jgi:hypothetical protein
MKTRDAVKAVCNQIRKDPELYLAYQANIAMAFYDEYRRRAKNSKYVSRTKLHLIANSAAKNFLDLWIS